MSVTQKYHPAFALGDVDAVALSFEGSLATGQVLTNPVVAVSGGFTVGTPRIGTVNETTGAFTEEAGIWVYVLLTATEVGDWTVTFTASVDDGRLLHRAERVDVRAARS